MGAYRKLLRETCRLDRARRLEKQDRKELDRSEMFAWKQHKLGQEECGRLRAELAAERATVAELKAKLEATPEAVKKLELAVLELSLTAVRLTTERDESRAKVAELEKNLEYLKDREPFWKQRHDEEDARRKNAESRLEKALGLLLEISDPNARFYVSPPNGPDYIARVRAFLAECEPPATGAEPVEPLAGVDTKAFSEFCERQAAGFPQAEPPPLIEFPPEPEGGLKPGRCVFVGDYAICHLTPTRVLTATFRGYDIHEPFKLTEYALAVAACNEHAAKQKGAGV